MKLSRITFVAVLAIALMVAGTVFAQDNPVTIASILTAAKCPLTDAQKKQYDAIDFSQGFQGYQTLNEMFDDKQMEALKAALGTQPGRNDRPDRPRYLMQVVMFEKAKCPLMDSQLKKLMALPQGQGRGMGGGQEMMDILTDEQQEAMQGMRGGRGGGMGGGRGGN